MCLLPAGHALSVGVDCQVEREGRRAERSYVLAPHPGSSRLSVSQVGHQLVLPARETQTLTRREGGERGREREKVERERRKVEREKQAGHQMVLQARETQTLTRREGGERERETEGRLSLIHI